MMIRMEPTPSPAGELVETAGDIGDFLIGQGGDAGFGFIRCDSERDHLGAHIIPCQKVTDVLA